jgi:hypothetical protein
MLLALPALLSGDTGVGKAPSHRCLVGATLEQRSSTSPSKVRVDFQLRVCSLLKKHSR